MGTNNKKTIKLSAPNAIAELDQLSKSNNATVQNAADSYWNAKFTADSTKYPMDYKNVSRKDYVNEGSERTYNNFSHAITMYDYAKKHPFLAPIAAVAKEVQDAYKGIKDGNLAKHIYDSPVDMRNNVTGILSALTNVPREKFLKELPSKLQVENPRKHSEVDRAEMKDFVKNVFSPMSLQDSEYAKGGRIRVSGTSMSRSVRQALSPKIKKRAYVEGGEITASQIGTSQKAQIVKQMMGNSGIKNLFTGAKIERPVMDTSAKSESTSIVNNSFQLNEMKQRASQKAIEEKRQSDLIQKKNEAMLRSFNPQAINNPVKNIPVTPNTATVQQDYTRSPANPLFTVMSPDLGGQKNYRSGMGQDQVARENALDVSVAIAPEAVALGRHAIFPATKSAAITKGTARLAEELALARFGERIALAAKGLFHGTPQMNTANHVIHAGFGEPQHKFKGGKIRLKNC